MKKEMKTRQTVVAEVIKDRASGKLRLMEMEAMEVTVGLKEKLESKFEQESGISETAELQAAVNVHSCGIFCIALEDDAEGEKGYVCSFVYLGSDGRIREIPIAEVAANAREEDGIGG